MKHFFAIFFCIFAVMTAEAKAPASVKSAAKPGAVSTVGLNAASAVRLNAVGADSVATYKSLKFYKFEPIQLAVPVAMIGIGSLGCATSGILYQAKVNIREDMARIRCISGTERYYRFDDYIQFVPAAAYLTLGFIPSIKKNDFGHRALALATSAIAMTVMVNTLKYSVKEMRPNGSRANSFPSGHTATAFMGAELIRIEYGWGIGAGAYAVATTVAFMRLYNNMHWIGDVVAGAGIGILSAQIGYWLLPYTEKILPKRFRYISNIALAPQSSFPGSMELALRVEF